MCNLVSLKKGLTITHFPNLFRSTSASDHLWCLPVNHRRWSKRRMVFSFLKISQSMKRRVHLTVRNFSDYHDVRLQIKPAKKLLGKTSWISQLINTMRSIGALWAPHRKRWWLLEIFAQIRQLGKHRKSACQSQPTQLIPPAYPVSVCRFAIAVCHCLPRFKNDRMLTTWYWHFNHRSSLGHTSVTAKFTQWTSKWHCFQLYIALGALRELLSSR